MIEVSKNLAEAAVQYATWGIAVFPVLPGSKQPATRRGFYDASTNVKRVANWWKHNPQFNIGIPTGTNCRIEVLDIDVKNGNDGTWLLDQVVVKEQLDNAFAKVLTPSGGEHYWFRSKGQASGKLKGVDFKATGGYVLAPPSVIQFPNGKIRDYFFLYLRAVKPTDKQFDWDTVRRVFGPEGRYGTEKLGNRQYPIDLLARWMSEEPPGDRNNQLFHRACIALESGYRNLTPLYLAALQAGLEEHEIETTIKSAGRTYGIRIE